MKGTISSSSSTTSTFTPRAANRPASSTPMTPPPMTHSRRGTSATSMRPVESTTLGLPRVPGMGGMAGAEPVARITTGASRTSPPAITRPGPSSVPSAERISTPWWSSVCTRLARSFSTTWAFQACMAAQS